MVDTMLINSMDSGKRDILRCLRHAKAPLTLTEIAMRTNFYITEVSTIVGQFLEIGLVELANGYLTINPAKCSRPHSIDMGLVKRNVKAALQRRPKAVPEFDQCLATEDTILRRVDFIQERSDLFDNNILVLGDDDFLSIGLASTGLPRSITVLDVDPRVLESIGCVASENNLSIILENYDVRKELPWEHKGVFDVVFTDPPYTCGGAKLFLWRAVQAVELQVGRRLYICLSEMDLTPESYSSIQSFALRIGLAIVEIVPSFNKYESRIDMTDHCDIVGADPCTPWFTSALWRLETTPNTSKELTPLDRESILLADIYKYDAEID